MNISEISPFNFIKSKPEGTSEDFFFGVRSEVFLFFLNSPRGAYVIGILKTMISCAAMYM